MNFMSLEEIKTCQDLQRIMNHMMKTMDGMGDVPIERVQVPDELLHGETLDKEELFPFIDVDSTPGVFRFPYCDQREDPLYKEKTFLGRKIVPAKGHYWIVDVEQTWEGFGLLSLDLLVKKMGVNPSNKQHEKVQVVYKEEKKFYYDYEKGFYVRVELKEKVKKEEQKERILEYKRRRGLLGAVNKRLAVKNVEYVNLVERVAESLPAIEHLKSKTVGEYERQFRFWFNRIHELRPLLTIKYLSGHTDVTNYLSLTSELETLETKLSEDLKMLVSRDVKEHLIPSDDDWSMGIRKRGGTLHILNYLFIERTQKRKIGKKEKVSFVGFYSHNRERVFENITQIELKLAFSLDFDSESQYEEMCRKVHEGLLNRKDGERDEVVPDLFTVEEWERINEAKSPKDRSFFIHSTLDQCIRDGRIERKQKSAFLRKFSE